jgi:hypothetical protein
MFLLKQIIEYHGGTRGMDIGLYQTCEEAKRAWKAYKLERETPDSDYDSETDTGYPGYPTKNGKIVEIEVGAPATEWTHAKPDIDLDPD